MQDSSEEQLSVMNTSPRSDQTLNVVNLTTLVFNEFKEIYSTNDTSPENIYFAMLEYPRNNLVFDWVYHILSGRVILAPLKNSLKFIIEFIPAVIKALALHANNQAIERYGNIPWVNNGNDFNGSRYLFSITIFILGLISGIASIIGLITSRITSPMRSFRTAWHRHPFLGVASSLLTIVATGLIGFFLTPILLTALTITGSATLITVAEAIQTVFTVIATPIVDLTGLSLLTGNLVAVGSGIFSACFLFLLPLKFFMTNNENVKPPVVGVEIDLYGSAISENVEYPDASPTARMIRNTISIFSHQLINSTIENSCMRKNSEEKTAFNDANHTKNEEMLRYHPLLSTIQEAIDNLEKNQACNFQEAELNYLSDHLPIMTEINLSNKVRLKLFNWNILKPNAVSGLVAFETTEAILCRERGIIKSILNMLRKYKPDIFFLQECWLSIDKLIADLKHIGYSLENDTKGRVTITNISVLKIESTISHDGNDPNGYLYVTQTLAFIFHRNNKIILNNVHLPHNDNPHLAEQYITSLISDKLCPVIIAGDFNNRYVPLNVQPGKLIVNNVVHNGFRLESNIQGCDFTDGYFYSIENSKCRQPENIFVINPFTAEVFRRPSIDLNRFTAEQKDELESQRFVLSCVDERDVKHLLGSELTDYLRNKNIFVGFSSNSINNNGIGISINNSNASIFIDALSKAMITGIDGIQVKIVRDGNGQKIGKNYFIPSAKITQLLKVIKEIYLAKEPKKFFFQNSHINTLFNKIPTSKLDNNDFLQGIRNVLMCKKP
jgi:hypothetical protein